MRNLVLLILLLSAAGKIMHAQQLDSSHHVPVNKKLSNAWQTSLLSPEKKIYRGNELLTIGMPCGGIAAGQLYVRGDGTLANWWIANNAYNTGYGVDSLTRFNTAVGPWKVCYQTYEPFSYFAQGFSVTVIDNGKKKTRHLDKQDFDDISFVGEYPIAKIDYASTKDPFPVSVSAEVFSPFIPMNARESATPGTILKYRVKNTSSRPVTTTLNGWLQNIVCLEIAPEINASSRNRIVHVKDMTSLVLDLAPRVLAAEKQPTVILFDDFESGYKKWSVSGAAFGTAPANGSFGGDQSSLFNFSGNRVVNSFLKGDSTMGEMKSDPFIITANYIVFKLGGGNHPKTTCMNLIINDSIVRTATGNNTEGLNNYNWDVSNLKGQKAFFQIVDHEQGGWGHINLDDIGFSDLPVTRKKYFPDQHPYFGNMSLSVLGNDAYGDADYQSDEDVNRSDSSASITGKKLVGSIGTTFVLKPGEKKEISFLLTWYFPNRPAYYAGSDVTNMLPNDWNQALPVENVSIIGNMYSNWFSNSSDVTNYLSKNLQRLSAATHLFHDTYYNKSTLPYWINSRTLMPLSILATETCQWWANDKFWAWEGVGSCVGTCTHVWNYEQALAHFFPDLERNVRERTDFDISFQKDGSILARNGWGGVLLDGHLGAILKAYREHLNSKDILFLTRNWDRIRRATEFAIGEDGNDDGLIEKVQANTYDIAFYGANTYVGSLYLAALKAASEMATLMKDTAFSARCLLIAKRGGENTVRRLWNGEYFTQDVNLKDHPDFQYANGCLSDQLFGQTWAHLTRLGYIYPLDNVKQTLRSVWNYNWAPDVGTQNKVHPPERTYANPGEPGLLICTWPKGQHMGEKGVRYRDEVWTGIEYQVATNMIYEDMLPEGLSLLRAIHARYSPEKHNPWNEIECGDHYARAMASWGVMLALEDFYYNGPEKIIGFSPKIGKENFEGFFTAAEGWGNLQQKQSKAGQFNAILTKYGTVALRQLQVRVSQHVSKVSVSVNGLLKSATWSVDGNLIKVDFPEVVLRAGDEISLQIAY